MSQSATIHELSRDSYAEHSTGAVVRATAALQRQLLAGLRAYSALLFGRSVAAALLVLGASCFDPSAGVAGLAAIVASAATVHALGYRRDLADTGYYAANSLLCGLALGHSQPLSYALIGQALMLGAVAALLTAGLSELLGRLVQLPVLALPFVMASGALVPLLGVRAATAGQTRYCVPDLPVHLPAVATATLRAFGSIVFQPTTAAGLLVLLAVVLESRITAVFGLVGVTLASVVSLLVAPHHNLTWIETARYNSLLGCVALGAVYFVPSLASLAWASLGALLAAWLTLSIGPVVAQSGWPLLAWPFVIVTLSMLRALGLRQSGFPPQSAPLLGASAEANLRYSRMLASRFGRAGTIRVNLPVRETWAVTQGFDGPHTHRGLWRHGLDFEILDADGFPFHDGGAVATDYYCFDAPVHAVMAGTVVFAYSNHPDNMPGSQDLAYPYGNVVVMQHGPALFSVLAHLRQGSVTVQIGQSVGVGALVGRCGSSGRSPRPHLHLQMQAAAELGSPTVPFELSHYALAREEVAEYVFSGIPKEGDRLAGSCALWTPELAILRPGAEFALLEKPRALRRFRSEISPFGERCLSDCTGREKLYFSSLDGVATFTTHRGPRPSPLLTLALSLPRIPPFDGELNMTESIPPEWLIPRYLAWLYDLIAFLGIHAVATVKSHVHRSDAERITAASDIELRWCGRVWRRLSALVTVRGRALASLRLTSARRVILEATEANDPRALAVQVRRRWQYEPALAFLTLPIIAGVAAASLMLSSTPSEARPTPNPVVESLRHESAGNLDQALEAAARAAAQSPRDYYPLLRLAYLEKLTKHYAAAASHYARAAELAPVAIEPLLGQVQALVAAGSFAKALTLADAALLLDQKSYIARSSRAWSLYQLGRYKDAVAEYSLVLELYPGDIEMRLGRAYSLAGLKRPVEAAMEFREVLKRVPTERRARVALGLP